MSDMDFDEVTDGIIERGRAALAVALQTECPDRKTPERNGDAAFLDNALDDI